MHTFQGGPAPQRKGRPEITQRFRNVLLSGRPCPARRQLLETRKVNTFRRRFDRVARQLCNDYALAKEPPQAGYRDLHLTSRSSGRCVAPQRVYDPVNGDNAPRLKKQKCQCDLLPGSNDGNWLIVDQNFYGAKQPKLHKPT
ncbi:MAG TPA: hypothetical protein VGG16_06385 [Streptosporangiaceae bacterium]